MRTEFHYENIKGDERIVEIPFFVKVINDYCFNYGNSSPKPELLDVGGQNSGFVSFISEKVNYHCCDMVCGDYRGNFLEYNFQGKLFNIITGLSSIEHFGFKGEDVEAFKKIEQLLDFNGIAVVSFPFGKYYEERELFYGFIHYDESRINMMIKKSGLIVEEERYFYFDPTLKYYVESDPDSLKDVVYRGNGAPNAGGLYLGVYSKEKLD